jgi:hypothetical protein
LIGDSASVVAFSNEILQGIERQTIICHIINIDLQLPTTDAKIALSELIRNIPPQRTILPPLLNKSMEKTKTEDQFLEGLRVQTAFEELLVADRVAQK